MLLNKFWGGEPPTAPVDAASCAEKRVRVLQGTLDAYECKIGTLRAALTELETELACKDEQVRVIRVVLEMQAPDEAHVQLAEARQEAAELRAALAKQRIRQEDAEDAAQQQLAALRAALAAANAQLKAAGARPLPASAAGGGDVAGDQQMLSPSGLAPPAKCGSPVPSEGPPTPLSPGQAPMLLRQARASGNSSSDGGGAALAGASGGGARASCASSPGCVRLAPVRCCSPVACALSSRYGAPGACAVQEEEEAASPRSDLSGPTFSAAGGFASGACTGDDERPAAGGDYPYLDCARCSSPGSLVASARARGSAAFNGRLARDNPLFRCSAESARRPWRGGGAGLGGAAPGYGAAALSSVDCGSTLRLSLASVDEVRTSLPGGGAAAFGLAKAQLEIQLHQAQQRLAAVQSSSEVAGNQAAAAQARLRASVRCLESLHALLKGALEQADGGRAPLDAKALRARLSGAVQELARLAKCQREMGGCLDMLRLLLQRMASGGPLDGEEGGEDEGAACPSGLAPRDAAVAE